MAQSIFIGVDGGATKCTVRVENEAGRLLGRETKGPANIRLSVTQTWQSIYSALEKILQPLGIQLGDKRYRFHAGMGLAGCEVLDAYHDFINQPHRFDTLIVSFDSHTACLGAHGGGDGAIIVVGTGVVGCQIESRQVVKAAGWGFPHDDEGGGAWLGLYAVKAALHWLDKREPASGLARAVYAYFDEDQARLVTWANQANSTAFAELAPIVIQQCQAGDPAATQLMREAALAIDSIGEALERSRQMHFPALPCSLVGGISPFIQPFLGEGLRKRIRPCQLPPDAGAVLLVRYFLGTHTK